MSGFLQGEDLRQDLQDPVLPGDLRGEDLTGGRGVYYGKNIFFVDETILRGQQKRGKDDIGNGRASPGFKAVKNAAVDENTASFGQFQLLCTYKTAGSAVRDDHKFQFMVPVPVNAVEIKLPDIFRIVGKRISAVSMLYGFIEGVVGGDLINAHRNLVS